MTKQKKQEQEEQIDISDASLIISHDPKLTERELEILNLLKLGLSSKLIADLLPVKSNTVDTHRKNIIKKLKAENIGHAIAIAFANKIILVNNEPKPAKHTPKSLTNTKENDTKKPKL